MRVSAKKNVRIWKNGVGIEGWDSIGKGLGFGQVRGLNSKKEFTAMSFVSLVNGVHDYVIGLADFGVSDGGSGLHGFHLSEEVGVEEAGNHTSNCWGNPVHLWENCGTTTLRRGKINT